MPCVVKFTLGGEDGKNLEFTFNDYDNSEGSSIEYILSQIYKNYNVNKDDWSKIVQLLLEEDYKVKEINTSMKEAIEKKAILPHNYNSSHYVEGTNYDVLLVSGIKSLADKTYSFGTRLIQNGKELFIVKNSPSNLKIFKRFLELQKQVKDKYEPSESDNYILNIVNNKSKKKFNTFNDLVLSFITDKAYFEKQHSEAYVYLDDFCNKFLGYTQKKIFNNEPLNLLYRGATFSDYGKILTIRFNQFENVVKRWLSSGEAIDDGNGNIVLQLDPSKNNNKEESFQEYYTKKLSQVKDDMYQDNPLWKRIGLTQDNVEKYKDFPVFVIILTQILRTDENFDYRFRESKNISKPNGTIMLAKRDTRFEKKYKYDFPTIKRFIVSDFKKTFGIFEHEGKFYVSKSVINKDTDDVMGFDSEKKAEKYIDLMYSNSKIGLETTLFRKVYGLYTDDKYSDNGRQYIPDKLHGQILRVLQLPYELQSSKNFVLNQAEKKFINSDATISNFFKNFIYTNWDLSRDKSDEKLIERMRKVLDDPQKIITLFYLTQNGDSNNQKSKLYISEALDKIEKLQYDFYKPLDRQQYIKIEKLIEVTEGPSTITDFYSPRHALDEFAYKIQNITRGRVKVRIMTTNQIQNDEETKDLIPYSKAKSVKGFVHNNVIYINSETAQLDDLAHEYFHIVLAIFKSHPNYYNFLDKFRELVETDENVKKIYSNLKNDDFYSKFAEYDILEETLARSFGQYIQKGTIFDPNFVDQLYISNIKFSDIVNSSNLTLTELFEKMQLENASDGFYKMFPKQNEAYTLSRKITNFIASKIGKEIKEDCD